MNYDDWKLENAEDERERLTRRSRQERLEAECDCCGQMKYSCRDVWISYAGDTHACPQCLGDDDDV